MENYIILPRFKGSSKGYSINDKLSFIPGLCSGGDLSATTK